MKIFVLPFTFIFAYCPTSCW